MSLVDIIKSIIDLLMIPINEMFEIKIEIIDGYTCSLGVLFISFLTITLTLYMVISTLNKKGDE